MNGEAEFLARYIEAVEPHGFHVVARTSLSPESPFETQMKKLQELADDTKAAALICAEKRLSVGQIMQVLQLGERLRIPVKVLSDKLDVLPNQARITVDRVNGIPLVHFESLDDRRWIEPVRRATAMVLAALGLVLLLAVMVIIRLTSQGPIFFVQERVGVDRRPFRIYKFRTMYTHADEQRVEVEELNESPGVVFKMRNDPRVTPVGRFLRRFSLDEMPQLINVLKGDMTIVGPRPLPRRDFQNYYEEWHYSRHGGMPGLTCLWQVSGRSDVDFHNMCILDVYYLRNRCWSLDLVILLRTVWAVLFARGAY